MSDVSFRHPVKNIEFSFGIGSDAKACVDVRWECVSKADSIGYFLMVDDRGWSFVHHKQDLLVMNTSPADEVVELRPLITAELVDCLLAMNSCFASQRPFALTKQWVTRIAEAVGIPIDTAFDVELSEVFDERS